MNTKRITNTLLWTCLVLVIGITTYTIFFRYQAAFNTDAAQKVIIARHAFIEGTPIPKQWIYANGDLWFIGPQLFTIIFYPLLGLSYGLVATSDWLSLLYLLLIIFGVCRALDPKHCSSAIIATALAASGISVANFEFVIGQAFYAIYPALAIALYALVSRSPILSEHRSNGRYRYLVFSGIAATLICVSNPSRGLLTVIVPALIGWFASYSVQTYFARQRHNRTPKTVSTKHALTVLPAVVGAVVGAAIYLLWLSKGMLTTSGAATTAIASIPVMVQHISELPGAWLEYFRIGIQWSTLPAYTRVLQASVWVLSVAILVAPIWVVATTRRRSSSLVTFAWMVIATFAVVIGLLVVSSSLFVDYTVFRYATPAIYGSLCLVAIQATTTARRAHASAYVVPALFLLAALTIVAWAPFQRAGVPSLKSHRDLISSLRAHRVGTVLATYWNSYVLTVLSHGQVFAYPTKIVHDSQLVRFDQNEPTEVTLGRAGRLEAVALTSREGTPAIWTSIRNEFGVPLETFRSGPFTVWVYAKKAVQLVYGVGFRIDKAIQGDQLGVSLSTMLLPLCHSAKSCQFTVTARNIGNAPLSSVGTKPLRLGISGLGANGEVIENDVGRADFPLPLPPGASERVDVVLPHASRQGIVRYRLCLLQENVAWHCNRTEIAVGHAKSPSPSAVGDADAALMEPSATSKTSRFHSTLKLQGHPTLTTNDQDILVHVQVTNDGARTFGSLTPPSGVNLGAHTINATGQIIDNDLARGHLPQIAPGRTALATISLPVAKLIGKRAEILPVAEDVGWFDQWGTQPLIVGPFHRCKGTTGRTVCGAAGQPLLPAPARSN